MFEFCRLSSAHDALFEAAFALYGASFPDHERRLLAGQAALMPNPAYHFEAILDDGAFTGILLYWDWETYAYIEHFAIHPSVRGRAVGSNVLRAFCAKCPLVILEIDPPYDEVSIRRENFYRRLGFKANAYTHKHPAYRKQFSPHSLVVMSSPRQLAKEEYNMFFRQLCAEVMRDSPV